MRKKGSKEGWETRRMIAANMFDKDKETAEVVATVGVASSTVCQWRRAYRKGGRPALVGSKPTGRPRKLTDEQRRQLPALLAQGPAAHGYGDAYLWTTKLIARLIKDRFGVDHHHDHVGTILHELGITSQVPARRAKERDEVKIADWRDTLWPELLKKVPRRAGRSSRPTRSGS